MTAPDDLVERLRMLVSLNEPKHGGPYQGAAAAECVRAMAEAATRISQLTETVEKLRTALEPFATCADDIDETLPDLKENHGWTFRNGDFRRARKALTGEQE